jgi:hypothetical protein
VWLPFGVLALHSGPFGWWLTGTLAAALVTPYVAHAQTVVYYALREPGRPVVLERGRRWRSVWEEQAPSHDDLRRPAD